LYQWSGDRPIKTFYDNLSERSHPTFATFSAFYTWSREKTTKVLFSEPQREETQALLPEASLAVTMTLLFVQELFVEVQDADGALELKQLLTGESK